jgi:hypothetical protein
VAYEPISEIDESLIVALPSRMPKLVEGVSIPGSGPGALDAAR